MIVGEGVATMTTEEIARLRALCAKGSPRMPDTWGVTEMAEFIVNTRAALPRALDEIERLRDVIDETHDRLMFVRVRMLGVLPFDRKANTIDEAIAALSDAWHGRAT